MYRRGQCAAVIALMMVTMAIAYDGRAEDAPSAGSDFVDVCTAAIMQPDTLNKILMERGLDSPTASDSGARKVMQVSAKSRGWNLAVMEVRFSDFSIKSCVLAASKLLGPEELKSAKERLEAMPGIGKMEGSFREPAYSMIAAVFEGVFKRPGNKPSLILEMQSVRMPTIREKQITEATTLQLHRYDFSAEK